jgi:hypothetical protein
MATATATLPARLETPRGEIQMTSGLPAIKQAMETLKSIRTFVAEEMREGTDFGKIPGTGDKLVMLLPGAQKVFMYFDTYPKYRVQRHELGEGHLEVVVTTNVINRRNGSVIGTGVGSCSTKETKYRYRNGERQCPKCGGANIIKGKEEFGGGWLCFKKKGGCGAKFDDGDRSIESQAVGKVENDNIHDQRNTVLKMGKKRSAVDASIGLGCLSELFTQDIEDTYDIGTPAQASPAREPEPA